MVKKIFFILLGLTSLLITGCSCEESDEEFYVTYSVAGNKTTGSEAFSKARFAVFVDGVEVSLPYTKTVGPVERGYACNMNVVVESKNCSCNCWGSIAVNGTAVAHDEVNQSFTNTLITNGFNLSFVIK